MKQVFKVLAFAIAIPIVLFGLFLLVVTISDYKPSPTELLKEQTGQVINVDDTFRIFNWNIGYAGLGNDMSFFYDGGDRVRTSKERTLSNLNNISDLLKSQTDSVDFFLLQEVDQDSKRSYGINELSHFGEALSAYESGFAYNYKVSFVPVPMSEPLGKVKGGLATFSKLKANSVTRFSFEGNYVWPKGLFLLDRCFMVHRYSTSNGKEFLLINTHNSAYDDGSLRTRQMEMLREFLIAENNKGNYIVVGGDWNQEPPMAKSQADEGKRGHLTSLQVSADFMPVDWHWIHNHNAPTNRLIDEVYNEKTTKTSVIDFFLVSPNIEAINSTNINLNFEHSDHHPVFISFSFKK